MATSPYQSVLQLNPQTFIKYPFPYLMPWGAWWEGYTHTHPAPETFQIQLIFWDIYLRKHETKPMWMGNKRSPDDTTYFKCNGFSCNDWGKLHRGSSSWIGPREWKVLFKKEVGSSGHQGGGETRVSSPTEWEVRRYTHSRIKARLGWDTAEGYRGQR